MKPKLLVVDDDAGHRQMLEAVLLDEGYHIEIATNGLEAVTAVESDFFDLILMDMKMPKMDGVEALDKILVLSPKIPIIMMTAYASVATAIKTLKRGAYDYLNKPLDIEELKLLVKRALHYHRLEEENFHLRHQIIKQFQIENFIGISSAMQTLSEKIAVVAPTEATILINGESGTGKELVARAIHQHSHRNKLPMIEVNCAALPDTLLESELFGHTIGAFTGAVQSRKGRFQQAHGSSMLLDEIGEMDVGTQAKLLRVIQEGEIQPLGSDRTMKVDVRIIAATNKNLSEEIKNGTFREDLYYRLNVVPITVPPLRHRPEDVAPLAEHFLHRYAQKNQKQVKDFSPRAIDALMRYHWPGNIRELKNTVERAVILSHSNTITANDLPLILTPDSAHQRGKLNDRRNYLAPGRSLKEVEREMILLTLEDTGGNRTHAAKILGISRRTLQIKLKEYRLNDN